MRHNVFLRETLSIKITPFYPLEVNKITLAMKNNDFNNKKIIVSNFDLVFLPSSRRKLKENTEQV